MSATQNDGGSNNIVSLKSSAEQNARQKMSLVVDTLNDHVCEDAIVNSLRDDVLMSEIGRTKPKDGEDEEFFRVLGAFYTRLFVECAARQWLMEATLREYYLKKAA